MSNSELFSPQTCLQLQQHDSNQEGSLNSGIFSQLKLDETSLDLGLGTLDSVPTHQEPKSNQLEESALSIDLSVIAEFPYSLDYSEPVLERIPTPISTPDWLGVLLSSQVQESVCTEKSIQTMKPTSEVYDPSHEYFDVNKTRANIDSGNCLPPLSLGHNAIQSALPWTEPAGCHSTRGLSLSGWMKTNSRKVRSPKLMIKKFGPFKTAIAVLTSSTSNLLGCARTLTKMRGRGTTGSKLTETDNSSCAQKRTVNAHTTTLARYPMDRTESLDLMMGLEMTTVTRDMKLNMTQMEKESTVLDLPPMRKKTRLNTPLDNQFLIDLTQESQTDTSKLEVDELCESLCLGDFQLNPNGSVGWDLDTATQLSDPDWLSETGSVYSSR